jgi:hypothetical protein
MKPSQCNLAKKLRKFHNGRCPGRTTRMGHRGSLSFVGRESLKVITIQGMSGRRGRRKLTLNNSMGLLAGGGDIIVDDASLVGV